VKQRGLLAAQQHLIPESAEELGFSVQKSVHISTFEGV
jgi:hypothetical protein